jgi:hypothetical protein
MSRRNRRRYPEGLSPVRAAKRAHGKAKQRPAEAAGATGSLAGFVAAVALGERTAIVTAAAGLLPAIWTFWRDNEGWTGIKNIFKCGRTKCHEQPPVEGATVSQEG